MGESRFRWLSKVFYLINLAIYVLAIAATVVVAILAMYMSASDIVRLLRSISTLTDVSIINALSSIFLVVLTIEIIEMFLEYFRRGRIAADTVIIIVLTAISRELLINIANIGKLTIWEGTIMVLSIITLAASYYLVARAESLTKA